VTDVEDPGEVLLKCEKCRSTSGEWRSAECEVRSAEPPSAECGAAECGVRNWENGNIEHRTLNAEHRTEESGAYVRKRLDPDKALAALLADWHAALRTLALARAIIYPTELFDPVTAKIVAEMLVYNGNLEGALTGLGEEFGRKHAERIEEIRKMEAECESRKPINPSEGEA
jgi:hypothetical protein